MSLANMSLEKEMRDNFLKEKSIEMLLFYKQLGKLYEFIYPIHSRNMMHNYRAISQKKMEFKKKIKEEYLRYVHQIFQVLLSNLDWMHDPEYYIKEENKSYLTFNSEYGKALLKSKSNWMFTPEEDELIFDDLIDENNDNHNDNDNLANKEKEKKEMDLSELMFLLHCKWYLREKRAAIDVVSHIAKFTWLINYQILQIVATYLIRVNNERVVENQKLNSMYSFDIENNITSYLLFTNKEQELPKFYQYQIRGGNVLHLEKEAVSIESKYNFCKARIVEKIRDQFTIYEIKDNKFAIH